MSIFTRLFPCTVLAMAMIPSDAPKAQEAGSGSDERPSLGSPDAVDNQIDTDALTRDTLFDRRLPEGWFDWKDRLQEEKGISLGFDYSGLYFDASDAPDEGSASGGDFRFFGSWQLGGRGTDNSGSLVWKVEHRHKYGNIPPSELQFNLGGIGLIGPPFSDQGFRWTNLYWQQRWNNGEYVLLAGFLDVTDYLDAFGLGSPWLHFSNFAFSTGTTTIALPDDATLGVAGGAWLNDNIYLLASLTNANADPENPFNEVDSFFDESEYFTSLELGYTTSRDRAYLDNIHVTLWHVDEREDAVAPNGWGVNFSWTHYLADRWMPFIRGGYADDGGSLMQKSVSVGLGWQPKPGFGRDLLGVGLNWGQPNEDTWGTDLRDQYLAEAFYRIGITQQLAITPNIQYIKDPPQNPEMDSTWVLGVRARMAF